MSLDDMRFFQLELVSKLNQGPADNYSSAYTLLSEARQVLLGKISRFTGLEARVLENTKQLFPLSVISSGGYRAINPGETNFDLVYDFLEGYTDIPVQSQSFDDNQSSLIDVLNLARNQIISFEYEKALLGLSHKIALVGNGEFDIGPVQFNILLYDYMNTILNENLEAINHFININISNANQFFALDEINSLYASFKRDYKQAMDLTDMISQLDDGEAKSILALGLKKYASKAGKTLVKISNYIDNFDRISPDLPLDSKAIDAFKTLSKGRFDYTQGGWFPNLGYGESKIIPDNGPFSYKDNGYYNLIFRIASKQISHEEGFYVGVAANTSSGATLEKLKFFGIDKLRIAIHLDEILLNYTIPQTLVDDALTVYNGQDTQETLEVKEKINSFILRTGTGLSNTQNFTRYDNPNKRVFEDMNATAERMRPYLALETVK